MHFTKLLVSALVSATGSLAVPCDQCLQNSKLNITQPSSNHASFVDFTAFLRGGYHPDKDPLEHKLVSRANGLDMDHWREKVWLQSERNDWGGKTKHDYATIVEKHLPDGTSWDHLSDPLLPTTNHTVEKIYQQAAIQYEIHESKTYAAKKSEFAKLKNSAKHMMYASACLHDRDRCKVYYGPAFWKYYIWYWLNWVASWGGWGPRKGFKETVYDKMVVQTKERVELETLQKLGERLAREYGYKASKFDKSLATPA